MNEDGKIYDVTWTYIGVEELRDGAKRSARFEGGFIT